MARIQGLNRSLGSAIGAIALVALASGATVFVALHQLGAVNAARDRSNLILTELDAFRVAMLNQETGIRGYLLTGRQGSLAPYVFGRADFGAAVGKLRGLVAADAGQRRLLAQAEAAARGWQSEIAEPVLSDMSRPGGRDAAIALASTGADKASFDAFRESLAKIRVHEREALATRDRLVRHAGNRALAALGIGTLVTLIICAGVGVAISRLITRPLIELAEVMGRLVRRDMTARVPSMQQKNEVGDMARAVAVFKDSLIELDRTALLRVTADTLPAMVGYIDAERRIGFLNGEFARWFDFAGHDVSEVQGRPLAEVFAAKPLPGAAERLEPAFAGEEGRFEQPLTLATGERRDVEGYFRPHRGPKGHVLGVVTLLTDITDRKSLDRRLASQARDLARSNEELEQFAYVASHDLKAPLRGIENLVGWIEEDLAGTLTDDTRGNMGLLKSRVRRLESLLDDLLAYSRAGRRDDLTAVSVDTRALVAELAELISPPEGFAIVADESLPTLVTPRAPLAQALQNLIGNAIKHHPQAAEGQVTVAAEPRAEMVEFSVTDNGAGIADRYRARVFGMFQTLKPRDQVEGSGMGLAIVKKLVERQGGAIWLADGPGGSGLAVHFTWPAPREEIKYGPPG